ncbi:MAG: hypothetical protein ACLFVF_02125 [Thiohalospira sp.]
MSRAVVRRVVVVLAVLVAAAGTNPAVAGAAAPAPADQSHAQDHAHGGEAAHTGGHDEHDGHQAGCSCDDLATLFCCGADCSDGCASGCAPGSASGALLIGAAIALPREAAETRRPGNRRTPRQPGLAPEGPPPQHA